MSLKRNQFWKGVSTKHKLVIAKCNFTQKVYDGVPHALYFFVGESLQVLEQCPGWYRGFRSCNPTVLGIFPQAFVEHRRCLTEGLGLMEPAGADEDRLVTELKEALRDWLAFIRDTFTEDAERSRSSLTSMAALLEMLQEYRHESCTKQRRRELKTKLTTQADRLNRMLGLPLVPRRAGLSLNTSELSLAELQSVHEASIDLVDKQKRSSAEIKSEQVRLSFGSLKLNANQASEQLLLYLYLYNPQRGAPVTERFLCEIVGTTLSSKVAVFTGLGTEDMTVNLYLIGELYRKGRMLVDAKKSSQRSSAVQYRRPLGGCVWDVNLLRNLKYSSRNQTISLYSFTEDTFASCLENLRRNSTSRGTCIGELTVELSLVPDSEVLLHESFTPKVGFPEIIHPGDSRNDLFIEMDRADFERGTKSTGKNIEIKVSVVTSSGGKRKDCLSVGCGVRLVSHYLSFVYYHNNQPRWVNDGFKLSLPVAEFKDCHLVFRVYHGSKGGDEKKLHAFGFLLPQKVMDGLHTVLLYKPLQGDAHRYLEVKLLEPANYLSVAALAEETSVGQMNQHVTRSGRDVLHVRTALYSTGFTHNVVLRSFLGWRDVSMEAAVERMKDLELKLSSQNNTAICNDVILFLSHVLDAEFSLLQQLGSRSTGLSSPDSWSRACLALLVRTLLLVQSRAYRGFRRVLNEYRTQVFCGPLLHRDLELSIEQCCCVDVAHSDPHLLQSLMQVFPELCDFFTESYKQFVKEKRLHYGSAVQACDTRVLMKSLSQVLQLPATDDMLQVHMTLLRALPEAVLVLRSVLNYEQLAAGIKQVLLAPIEAAVGDSAPSVVLAEALLTCLQSLLRNAQLSVENVDVEEVGDRLAAEDSCEFAVRPELLELLRHLVLPQLRALPKLAVGCFNFFLAAVHRAGPDDSRAINNLTFLAVELLEPLLDVVLELCTPSSFDFELTASTGGAPRASCVSGARPEPLRRPRKSSVISCHSSFSSVGGSKSDGLPPALLSCLLCLLRLLDDQHYRLIISGCTEAAVLQELLCKVLRACSLAVEDSVYPADWASMKLHASSDLLHAIQPFAQMLRNDIGEEFSSDMNASTRGSPYTLSVFSYEQYSQVWELYFTFSIRFILQDCLDVRRYREGSSYQLMLRSCNLRAMMAIEIKEMWENLEPPNKYSLLMPLTPLVVRAALLPERDVRRDLLSLLLDMLLVAHQANAADGYPAMCDLIIDALDEHVQCGEGDPEFGPLLSDLGQQLVTGSRLAPFIEKVRLLLDDLLEYREAKEKGAFGEFQRDIISTATYNLMVRYEQHLGRAELASHYCAELQQLQEAKEHLAEAGLCALHRAKHETVGALPLKTPLQDEAVKLLSHAETWELCLPLLSDMIAQREQQRRFILCSQLLKLKASLLDKMESSERLPPKYYCIKFCGQGFPATVANKTFIKRGSAFDRLDDVAGKLEQEFPGLSWSSFTSLESSEEKRSSTQPHVELAFLKPEPEPTVLEACVHADDSYRRWRQYNQLRFFSLDTQFHKPYKNKQNEFKSLHLRRCVFTVRETLPSLLRWSEVVESQIEVLNPVQVALSKTLESTEVLCEIRAAVEKKPERVQELSRCLTGMVDAAVNGGIRNYLDAFFGCSSPTDGVTSDHRDELCSALSTQLMELKTALELHGTLSTIEELQTHLQKTFKFLTLEFHDKVIADALPTPSSQSQTFVYPKKQKQRSGDSTCEADSTASNGTSANSCLVSSPAPPRPVFAQPSPTPPPRPVGIQRSSSEQTPDSDRAPELPKRRPSQPHALTPHQQLKGSVPRPPNIPLPDIPCSQTQPHLQPLPSAPVQPVNDVSLPASSTALGEGTPRTAHTPETASISNASAQLHRQADDVSRRPPNPPNDCDVAPPLPERTIRPPLPPREPRPVTQLPAIPAPPQASSRLTPTTRRKISSP